MTRNATTFAAIALVTLATPACDKTAEPPAAKSTSTSTSTSEAPPAPKQEAVADPGKVAVTTGSASGSGSSVVNPAEAALKAGVSPAVDGKIAVGGQIAVSFGLAEPGDLPDTVLAFPVTKRGVTVFETMKEGSVLRVPIDKDGKFSIALGGDELSADEKKYAAYIVDDNTLAPGAREDLIKEVGKKDPDVASYTDAQLIAELKSSLARMKAERLGEQSHQDVPSGYVLVSMKASGDRVKEAATFKFIGLPAGSANLISFPLAQAKGNLGLGQIRISGNDAVADLPANGDAFSIDESVLKQMATTNDALKTLVNKYMNSYPETGESIEATPYFSWELVGDAKRAMTVLKKDGGELPSEYSSYIAYQSGEGVPPRFKIDDACAADENARDRWSLAWPAPIETRRQGGTSVETTGLANAGALRQALHLEFEGGNSTRQACGFETEAQFSGNQFGTHALEQIGLVDKFIWGDAGIPAGLWKLTRNGTEEARFDMAISSPMTKDNHARVFIPSVATGKECGFKVTDLVIKMKIWSAEAGDYVLTDGVAFNAVQTEFGGGIAASLDASPNDSSDNSIRFKAGEEGTGAFVFDPDGNGNMGDLTKTYDLPSCASHDASTPVARRFFMYYRAFGNSYNFQSSNN